MEQVRSILSNTQPNYKEHGRDSEQSNGQESDDNGVFRLAEILKTGYQSRKFSNTPTLNWIQTWRVSNLSSLKPE